MSSIVVQGESGGLRWIILYRIVVRIRTERDQTDLKGRMFEI